MVIDNLSGLAPNVSDCICRLATGGGFSARQLYTDNDELLVDVQRPVILNGIDDISTRPDLLDRSLIINLPTINDEHCQGEDELWSKFEQERPELLGALCTALSSAICKLPKTKLQRKPRMADFALWVTAAEEALGWSSGEFINTYHKNLKIGVVLGVEVSPAGQTLREFIAQRRSWKGTATELLRELNTVACADLAKSRAWPQTPQRLSNILRRLAPSLRKLNVGIEFTHSSGRWIQIDYCPETASYASEVASDKGYRKDDDRMPPFHKDANQNSSSCLKPMNYAVLDAEVAKDAKIPTQSNWGEI